MMAVDDIGVGAHLVLTASEQATDSAVIWSWTNLPEAKHLLIVVWLEVWVLITAL